MIRINLISRERRKERKVTRGAPITPSETAKQLSFLAVFLVTFAIGAYLWFDIQGTKERLTTAVGVATRERDRLKSIKDLVDNLEVEQSKLAQRLAVLLSLKNNLRTPLHSLFFIYLAQQENTEVMLTEVRQGSESENDIVILGESAKENLNRFADTLKGERIVRSLDITSQVGERFQLVLKFRPIRELKNTAEGTSADSTVEPEEEDADSENAGGVY